MPSLKYAKASLLTALLSMTYFFANATEMTISGTPPATATVGEQYDFRPVVENANRSELEFSYVNRPDWSPHYRSCGCLIGVPSEPGVYANIQIQAWDGEHFAQTPPFVITVQTAPAVGSAALSWSKPTQNTDGSALTNLAGYVIRYGTSAVALNSQISIGSPNSTDVEISNLAAGNWYFEIAAINTVNVESQFSALVSTAIR